MTTYTAKDIEVLALQLESKHHWSATPGFLVSVVAAVAACGALYVSLLQLQQPVKRPQHGTILRQQERRVFAQQAPFLLQSLNYRGRHRTRANLKRDCWRGHESHQCAGFC